MLFRSKRCVDKQKSEQSDREKARKAEERKAEADERERVSGTVSYTHLDVYKRQEVPAVPGPESVRGYLDAVEAQIRWKRARTVAARELETHLEDQQEEFLAEGHPPEEAERLAVEDMGEMCIRDRPWPRRRRTAPQPWRAAAH